MNSSKSDFQTSDFVRNWRGWAKATQGKGKSAPKTTNPWTKTTRNSPNQEIDPRQNLGLFFWGFSNLWWKSRNDGESVATESV
jgi:hypothetical protein